jgi:hypothetical protein
MLIVLRKCPLGTRARWLPHSDHRRNCIAHPRPIHYPQMRSVCKLAVLLLALSIFASPLIACLQPDATLTTEERECCRKMVGDCGKMPSSHSCCKTTVRETDPYLSNSRLPLSAPAQATVAILPVSMTIGLPDLASQSAPLSDAHAPPESPPAQPSILRI